MKHIIIDPPMGWKYGFPKKYEGEGFPDYAWFRSQGYPQELIDRGFLRSCRWWDCDDPPAPRSIDGS